MSPKRSEPKSFPVDGGPSLRLYRRIAVSFVVLALVLLMTVIYVSTVEAVIRITPSSEIVKTEFLLDVVKTPVRDNEIRGRVLSAIVTKTETYLPSGDGIQEVVGTSRGTVTLHNETGADQTLVRTTRLLAPDGTLFRLDRQVNIPARGTVDAPVYADQPGKSGDLAPTKFTIPGLYPEKQKVVYATSSKGFTGGLSRVAAIGQADIDRAAGTLKEQLEAEAKAQLRTRAGSELGGESYSVDVVSQTSSVAAGAQAGSFDLTMSVRVVGAFFDQVGVQDLASRALFQALPAGKRFAEVNASGLQTAVEKVNLTEEKANVRVYLDGRAIPSASAASLDAARFAGMTEDEVRKTLMDEGVATQVDVVFAPAFIRRVPRLKDHIRVEIAP